MSHNKEMFGHPASATLEAFALGRLTSPDVERVEAHLGSCLECGRAIEAVPADRLINLLRRDNGIGELVVADSKN